MSQAIKVVVRVRPMNAKETAANCQPALRISEGDGQITVCKPGDAESTKSFAFDSVFGEASLQALVYEKTAFRLVESVLEGYNGTIFAYGQTGCGKTHSMVGKLQDQQLHGLIPRSFTHVLKAAADSTEKQFLIRCSFIEIYNEEIHDLLGVDCKARLDIKESPDKGIFVKDLSVNIAKTYDELMNFMEVGNKNRSVGETLMNKDSSRSHSMFTLLIESVERGPKGEDRYKAAKLNLVDLAGSERISKTGVSGDRLKEAQKINLSLSALGNVISALVDGKSQHVPYRDSKLTRLLQDSLGGNTKTVMIANCSPADYNYDETLSTLRYASRAKFIKNKPIINEDPKDALLKQYADQIRKLKQMLQNVGSDAQQHVRTDPAKPHRSSEHEDHRNLLEAKEHELQEQVKERQRLEERIRILQHQTVEGTNTHIQPQQIRDLIEAKQHLQKTQGSAMRRSGSIQLPDPKKLPSEQLESYKKLDQKQKQRIRQLERDIVDANKETFADKQVLLDEVRTLVNDSKLNKSILEMLLTREEQTMLQNAVVYNQETESYELQRFTMREKRPSLPKLAIVRRPSLNDKQEPSEHKLSIKCLPNNVPQPSIRDSFCLNSIIKDAKADHHSRNIHNSIRVQRCSKYPGSNFHGVK